MGLRILTDIEGMQEASSEFDMVIEEVKNEYETVKNLINRLETSWNGPASAEYIQRLRNQLNEIENLINAVVAMRSTAQNRIRQAEIIDWHSFEHFGSINDAIGDAYLEMQMLWNSIFN